MSIRTSALKSVFDSLGLSNRKRRKGVRATKRRAFSLEPLESRTLLNVGPLHVTNGHTCTWTGGGGNDLWSTAGNWSGGVVPASTDFLVFAGTTNTQTYNDLTANMGLQSIVFQNSDFTLSGNSVGVSNSITVDSGVSGSTIALAVNFGYSPGSSICWEAAWQSREAFPARAT